MTTTYSSNYDETVPVSDTTFQIHLTDAENQMITIPGTPDQLYQARFSYTYNSNVFMGKNAVPTVPVGDSANNQAYNEFRPGGDGSKRYFKGGDELFFETPDAAAYFSVSLILILT